MPRVLPFAALRYASTAAEDVAAVICPPYDIISADEQARLYAQSPYNAVALELPQDEPEQAGSRYTRAAQTLKAWQREGVLRRDARPAYYLSSTRFSHGGQEYERRDLIAAIAVEPWSRSHVLPHEDTMAGPKQDRLQLLRSTKLNASPIWVMYREPLPAVQRAWDELTEPVADFTWRGEQHRLWLVDDPRTTNAIENEFAGSSAVYIADGHHRYETALAYRAEAKADVQGARETMAVLTWANDPGLLVLPTHRLLRDLDSDLTLEEVEARWSDVFHTEYYPVWEAAPPEQIDALMQQLASNGRTSSTFGLLGLGHLDLFGLLELRGGKPPADRLPAERSEAWKKLDVSLLHTLLIDPLVAESHKPRSEVLSFTRDPHEAFKTVREGEASAAFFLNATPVEGVLAVADAGDRMPEKSTYFYPKPPAGLVMRDLEQ
ncbi:MAG TPA: DUF1015 domain-containing protein [Chloroflexota bacterium]|nr:DUF1015 domain-containing protein [Chloroflexota bacterium]